MGRRSTVSVKSSTVRLPRRIAPLGGPIHPPSSRTIPKPAKTTGLKNLDKTRFKDAAQAANMTKADILRGHGLYGDVEKGDPPVPPT